MLCFEWVNFIFPRKQRKMKKEKSFPVVSLVILIVFGLLCFIGGALSSNILNKRKVNAIQARLTECENKFLSFSRQVIGNIEAAVRISEGVSNVWHESVKRGEDFNGAMVKFLEENKGRISDMKLKHDLIEIQVAELKKYKKESRDTFDAVMELYDVYKKMYELGMSPEGTVEGFDSNLKSLVEVYSHAQSKLSVYMPELKKPAGLEPDVPAVQTPPQSQDAPAAQAPVVSAVQPLTAGPSQQPALTYDQKIKRISKNMTYRQVESEVGVPRDKKKDSRGNEVWFYPSEKTGFRNLVYFASGKVLQTKNLPLNSSLD